MFNEFEVTQSNVRVIELENGNKLHLTKTDPYGAISLSLARGQLPVSYRGCYTTWHQAEQAAQRYVSERQSVVAEITDKEVKKKAS